MRRALGFLSVLGGATSPSAAALPWFPVVGALLGLAIGGVWVGAGHVWPAGVAAVLAVTADAILTGGLHLDGLADTGDGLLPALPPDRRLAVMSDPHLGAFGAITLAIVLLLRVATFAAGPVELWIVPAVWCGSRTAAAVVLLVGRYARADGMASAFRDGATPRRRLIAVAIVGVAISVATASVRRPGHGLAALGAEVVVVATLSAFARRRLGGYTGDVLGADIVLGETAAMVVWAARW